MSDPMLRSAVTSGCGRFRYLLSRQWGADGHRLAFVMLNPSTADAIYDDPTIRRCIGFGQRLCYAAVDVVNLYAYRATKPADLRTAGWPRGPENDAYIERACRGAHMVICAWGTNAARMARAGEVLEIIKGTGKTPMALRITNGVPHHPLMLPYECAPVEFPR